MRTLPVEFLRLLFKSCAVALYWPSQEHRKPSAQPSASPFVARRRPSDSKIVDSSVNANVVPREVTPSKLKAPCLEPAHSLLNLDLRVVLPKILSLKYGNVARLVLAAIFCSVFANRRSEPPSFSAARNIAHLLCFLDGQVYVVNCSLLLKQ